MSKRMDLTGNQYGFLVVTGYARTSNRVAFWACLCVCGRAIEVRSICLRKGQTQSCGCKTSELIQSKRKRHGKKKSKVYNSWMGMRSRCNNMNNNRYHAYGARGIKVCEEWNSFESFYEHMGDPPSNRHSIDRIDVNGNYEPGNVKWSTAKDQANNTRRNVFISHNGMTLTISQWANKVGIPSGTLWSRYNVHGWSIPKTLDTPVGYRQLAERVANNDAE